ncbi:glycoside hydrolase family 127 protein [Chryseolinea lacunae]|uniref:Glycoside hydrolase family 127 protein n=1 Tax=Chryseolinea lacunae TaxID=2801331 RepID=A0ABS1KK50_9BACT|nr:glycoside hydrolase family 127 protein [Chryseolinea lacunae]MBL0739826.1 glycoside hydrolase family 127 protein [Chryseolinea lacunae]
MLSFISSHTRRHAVALAVFSLFGVVATVRDANGQSYLPDENNARVKVKPQVAIAAYPFALNEVNLLPSVFTDARDADIKYLLVIEPDRLLSQFRTHSGLKPKAEKYGGWESDGLAGHTLGHYLSACAIEYAVSGNPEFLKRVNYIVDELEACQVARKTGYVGAIPREDSVFMEVSQGQIRSRGFDLNGSWSPWYTIHKVMAGLLDAYLYCNNDKALAIEQRMADWTETTLKNLNDEQIQKMLLCEYGGMNEVLVNTYAFTKNKKYLDLSYKFHDKVVLDSLAKRVDILPGRHSNTQIPKVIGTVRRYELTGAKSDFVIGDFFWKTVVNHHSYAPGGNSNYEYLSEADKLNDKLTDNTMETCNTYNMLKLTRHLFALQPSAELMEYYERGLYNHILASQNHKTGMMCYFVPLRMGTRKEFSDEFNTFTCCVGSGIENHVKYGESIFFRGKDGSVYVNLFIPSVLNWKEKDFRLTLNSKIPQEKTIRLTIQTSQAQTRTIRIRKPQWAPKEIVVRVNGKAVAASVAQDGYIALTQKWKNNDEIAVDFESSLHAVAMPDNKDRKAFFYGPILLAGNLGTSEPDPATGIPVLVSDEADANKLFVAESKDALVFKTNKIGAPSDVTLQPFYSVADEFYTVYWDVFSPLAWKDEQQRYEEKKKAAYELEKSTVDELRVGEMQPERDHNFTGENLETGESHTRKFRVANDGGSFSFTMKVASGFSYNLIATYWGMDNRGRNFDILVDGEKIASVDLNKFKESKFYDIAYKVPTHLVTGKTSVKVTFQAKAKNQAGPLFGVRLVKESR